MGLDMVPMGKPKKGYEQRFSYLYSMLMQDDIPQPGILGRLFRKKVPSKDELLDEWFEIQIEPYETIQAPKAGKDPEADAWVRHQYEKLSDKPPMEAFLKEFHGRYIPELAKKKEGTSVYLASAYDIISFRGQFLNLCIDLIGKDLVNEAWNSKNAEETLDYGNRLMEAADKIANANNLTCLKTQRVPPDVDEDTIESQLHIVFSLAKWLIFYGENGHGYEANY